MKKVLVIVFGIILIVLSINIEDLIGNQGIIDSNIVDSALIIDTNDYITLNNKAYNVGTSDGGVDIQTIGWQDANSMVHIIRHNLDKTMIDIGAKWFFDQYLKQMCDDYIKENCVLQSEFLKLKEQLKFGKDTIVYVNGIPCTSEKMIEQVKLDIVNANRTK